MFAFLRTLIYWKAEKGKVAEMKRSNGMNLKTNHQNDLQQKKGADVQLNLIFE